MRQFATFSLLCIILFSCTFDDHFSTEWAGKSELQYGSDFSIMKKMEDFGGTYKIGGIEKEGLQIFKENGFTWARLRIFHTPEMRGPVCNDLDYTIALAHKAKLFGFKLLLNFHYSDTWADPGHQTLPKAWENLSLEILADSVYAYTKKVIEAMVDAKVQPDMVQLGNEINNGMMWPHGKLWVDSEIADWSGLATLLKAGTKGARDAQNNSFIPILIHAATGGNRVGSYNFYRNILIKGVEFDVIGLSYYPWWHGTLDQFEETLYYLSTKLDKDISVVETAYYSNNWYPEPDEWVLNVRPYPPTEQGQFNYMKELAKRLKKYPKVKSVFYWKPDELDIPESKVPYLGRSLFDKGGNAFKGISAWGPEK